MALFRPNNRAESKDVGYQKLFPFYVFIMWKLKKDHFISSSIISQCERPLKKEMVRDVNFVFIQEKSKKKKNRITF